MDDTNDSKPQPLKTKQANVWLTPEQERLLKQHCNRTGMTTMRRS